MKLLSARSISLDSTFQLNKPGFPHNLPVSCGDNGFKKAYFNYWLAFAASQAPCPLHPILLGDLVRNNSPLQIIMPIWCFFKIKLAAQVPVRYNGHSVIFFFNLYLQQKFWPRFMTTAANRWFFPETRILMPTNNLSFFRSAYNPLRIYLGDYF
jgi:hypothetical protein